MACGLSSRAAAQAPEAADAAAWRGWDVSALEIRGIGGALRDEVREGLGLYRPTRFLRGRERVALFPEALEEDLRRAVLFLGRRGFPEARVTPRFEPDTRRRRVEVTLEIDPGPAYRVAGVEFTGFPPAIELDARELIPLEPGDVFRDDELEESTRLLDMALREAGHARPDITTKVEETAPAWVDVRWNADAGPVYRFAEIRVEGAAPDLVPLVHRTLPITEGQIYTPSALRRADERLRLLNLFSQVRLQTEVIGPDRLALDVSLRERRAQSVAVGAGYWTEDQFRVSARWQHRNLIGGGRGVELQTAYAQFVQEVGASVTWPALFGGQTRGVFTARVQRQREETFRLLSTGFDVAGIYQPSLMTTAAVGATFSHVDVDVAAGAEEAFQERGGFLSNFFFRWNRTSTDDRLDPTTGYAAWFSTEIAPPYFLTDTHYYLAEAAGSVYRPVLQNLVAAVRVEAGAAIPIAGSSDLLPNKRFYEGGAHSMRGFARRRLGPLDPEGSPLGGESKLLASAELRFPIFWRIVGMAFVDAGQVWLRRDQLNLTELEIAGGPGIGIQTPVGPVRADYGIRLTDFEPTQPERVFHISIGHPF